jgi:cystathionine beta-lyase
MNDQGYEMKYDFDQIIERKGTDSIKWQRYGRDVLPLWVADMDFVSPEPIIQALHERVEHRVFGYALPDEELIHVIRERLKRIYSWDVPVEHIVLVPGVVTGLNLAFQLFAAPGDGVLVQPPVYSHFITDPILRGRELITSPLIKSGDSYEIDFFAFEHAISSRTRMYVLCNPHNPVGRVFRSDELERLARICVHHNILICSDEIHCDLVYPGHQHIPIATINDEIADRTITFMSPSKTYNLAGLKCAVAIIKNPVLREIWIRGSAGLIPHINIMGLTAALAGFRDGQEWLNQCLSYLKGNRDFLALYVREKLPSINMTNMEGTYLAWLDCRKSAIPGNPFHFFLKEARVALNDGVECGEGGKGFVRLNFACPRKILVEALDRMTNAIKRL